MFPNFRLIRDTARTLKHATRQFRAWYCRAAVIVDDLLERLELLFHAAEQAADLELGNEATLVS